MCQLFYMKSSLNNACLRVMIFLLGLMALPASGAETLDHQFFITLQPTTSQIDVDDTIHLPTKLVAHSRIHFLLHDGLSVTIKTAGAKLQKDKTIAKSLLALSKEFSVPVRQYTLHLAPDTHSIRLHYRGVINHPLKQIPNTLNQTPGLINKKGVFLSQGTLWYPFFIGDDLLTFSATITLPKGWQVVSQGKRSLWRQQKKQTVTRWDEHQPQEDIYLVAGRYQQYQQTAAKIQAMVFLREADTSLAQQYLDATGQYITMYDRLLGPYPYAKFALVENFWETGFGMPSFTLLGPQVIRFPFIIHSSYPHEILHNWWGNSVYADYDHGNWSEGLTAYLADHLIQEQQGKGAQYRRSALQTYTDYVSKGRDFPISEFHSRHNSATEAVGYDKSMMLFHMLRQQYGDATFVRALRQLYRQYRFKITSFDDVQRVFSNTVGSDLKPWFAQWVQRKGAPDLQINNVSVKPHGKLFSVQFTLQQQQATPVYQLRIPLAIQLVRQGMAYQTAVSMTAKIQDFTIDVPAKPLRLVIDPEFDVFRRLDSREIPAAMSQGFGAEHGLILLPSAAPVELRNAYRTLAQTWKKYQFGDFDIKLDKDVKALPSDRAVWLLGWNNRFVPQMRKALHLNPVEVQAQQVSIAGKRFKKQGNSVVLAARNPANRQQTLLWLATNNVKALPGMTRKLPHYRKYSYLAFNGDAPDNIAKGQWDVTDSPLWVTLTGKGSHLPVLRLIPRHALAQLPKVNPVSRRK
jgi:aminopeptidase N